MNSIRIIQFVVLALLVGASQFAAAQYTPEPDPRPGEQRLNNFQYLGTHNSFQRRYNGGRAAPINEQLDIYGHRHVGLDIAYARSGHTPQGTEADFWVQHLCGDNVGSGSLEEHLAEIANSQAVKSSFVWVHLDLLVDTTSNLCFKDMPSGWRDRLKNRFLAKFDQTIVYTAADFINIDNKKVPSVQELLRRGKRVAFVGSDMNWNDHGDFFLDNAETDNTDPNVVEGPRELEIPSGNWRTEWDLGDRFTSYFYPNDGLGFAEEYGQWNTAVENGYTFPTTYEVDDARRICDERLHPPLPMYVSPSPAISDPKDQFGTYGRPYGGGLGLLVGLSRIIRHEQLKGPSRIQVQIKAGVYDIDPFGSSAPHLNAAMELKAVGGSVEITR